MTAWAKSKSKLIIAALRSGRETSRQIAKRLGTTPEYVRAVASREGIASPVPKHCKHCGGRLVDQRTGIYARSACDECKADRHRKQMRERWQRQRAMEAQE